MNLCYNFLCYKFFLNLKIVKAEIENVFINNKIYLIYFNVQKKLYYIKIIFSGCVIGTPVRILTDTLYIDHNSS
jgi:hypothetical protein